MNRTVGGAWSAVMRIAGGRSRKMTVGAGDEPDFSAGQPVCSRVPVKNDGTYPHKDIGEIVVQKGDRGAIHERWSFLGQVYYTVEFVDRAVVVIMRGRELAGPS
jgi:NifZ domain